MGGMLVGLQTLKTVNQKHGFNNCGQGTRRRYSRARLPLRQAIIPLSKLMPLPIPWWWAQLFVDPASETGQTFFSFHIISCLPYLESRRRMSREVGPIWEVYTCEQVCYLRGFVWHVLGFSKSFWQTSSSKTTE